MIESGAASFEQDVVAASHHAPVLVDFWAPWCGPCRALGPLLERLEESYAGRFTLVKVNSDEHPELAARFNVRSIPFVVAFAGGEAVDSFVGALPEGQLRAFIERLMPGPAELERRKARALLAQGQPAAAAAALRAAIALDRGDDTAHLELAELLLERLPPPADAERLTEAERELAAVGARARSGPRWRALDTRLQSLRSAASLPALSDLQARVANEPGDLAARLHLAQRHIAGQELEAALEQLLEIVARNRRFDDGVGRRMALAVLELAADRPQLVSTYRRRLSALLNR